MGVIEVGELASELEVDLVLFSSATPTIDQDICLSSAIKCRRPRSVVGTLGIHATLFALDVLNSTPALDFILLGEPEGTLEDLVEHWQPGDPWIKMPGLMARDADGQIVDGGRRPFLEDLDQLPLPAWELLDRGMYKLPLLGRPFLMAAPSRGCPFPCTFCVAAAFYGKKMRHRSPGHFVDELEKNGKDFGVWESLFWAETFTWDKTQVLGICGEIHRRNLPVRWAATSRVDTVDLELFQTMKSAGCWMVSFGVESANTEVLDRSRKGQDLRATVEGVRLARRAGLMTTGHVMMGLPGDSKRAALSTLRFVRRLPLDFVQFYCAVPWPGSLLYEQAMEKGWLHATGWSDYVQDSAVFTEGAMRQVEVERFARWGARYFYLSPSRLARLALWRWNERRGTWFT